jgi:N6-L-threonylcarbamoyladenine synthase
MRILALESSCDETAAAVVEKTENGFSVLSSIVASQIETHRLYGGVVPEIASRAHIEAVSSVTYEAMERAGVSLSDIDLVAVTAQPGLIGALLVGVNFAKSLAFSRNIPLIAVDHVKAHVAASYLTREDLKPPFTALVVSGGHTSIYKVDGYTDFVQIGGTRDDAVGEAYDKVARVLGLGYPGGPLIDKIAREGNPKAVEFKRVFLEKGSLDFSFSGIKTGVLNYINSEKQAGREINVPDVAASFQAAVLEVIVAKTVGAALELGKDKIVLAGGVASNSMLREMLKAECDKKGIELFYPSPILCTDNAAMIGCAAYYKYMAGERDDLTLDAIPNLKL